MIYLNVRLARHMAIRLACRNFRLAAVVAGDIAALNSRYGPHSGHPCSGDISNPMACFKVLLTVASLSDWTHPNVC